MENLCIITSDSSLLSYLRLYFRQVCPVCTLKSLSTHTHSLYSSMLDFIHTLAF